LSSQEVIPRVGQQGTLFEATIQEPDGSGGFQAVDLTNESGTTVEIQRPDGSIISRAATVKSPPGIDGVVQYQDPVGGPSIFDVEGLWHFRGIATFTGGSTFPGSWQEQMVGK